MDQKLKRLQINMENIKTLINILLNVIILTVMFNMMWYFVPKMLEDFGSIMSIMVSSQIVAVIISFTYTPSESHKDPDKHWKAKAEGRTVFISFASVYIFVVEAIKWLFMMMSS